MVFYCNICHSTKSCAVLMHWFGRTTRTTSYLKGHTMCEDCSGQVSARQSRLPCTTCMEVLHGAAAGNRLSVVALAGDGGGPVVSEDVSSTYELLQDASGAMALKCGSAADAPLLPVVYVGAPVASIDAEAAAPELPERPAPQLGGVSGSTGVRMDTDDDGRVQTPQQYEEAVRASQEQAQRAAAENARLQAELAQLRAQQIARDEARVPPPAPVIRDAPREHVSGQQQQVQQLRDEMQLEQLQNELQSFQIRSERQRASEAYGIIDDVLARRRRRLMPMLVRTENLTSYHDNDTFSLDENQVGQEVLLRGL